MLLFVVCCVACARVTWRIKVTVNHPSLALPPPMTHHHPVHIYPYPTDGLQFRSHPTASDRIRPNPTVTPPPSLGGTALPSALAPSPVRHHCTVQSLTGAAVRGARAFVAPHRHALIAQGTSTGRSLRIDLRRRRISCGADKQSTPCLGTRAISVRLTSSARWQSLQRPAAPAISRGELAGHPVAARTRRRDMTHPTSCYRLGALCEHSASARFASSGRDRPLLTSLAPTPLPPQLAP